MLKIGGWHFWFTKFPGNNRAPWFWELFPDWKGCRLFGFTFHNARRGARLMIARGEMRIVMGDDDAPRPA